MVPSILTVWVGWTYSFFAPNADFTALWAKAPPFFMSSCILSLAFFLLMLSAALASSLARFVAMATSFATVLVGGNGVPIHLPSTSRCWYGSCSTALLMRLLHNSCRCFNALSETSFDLSWACSSLSLDSSLLILLWWFVVGAPSASVGHCTSLLPKDATLDLLSACLNLLWPFVSVNAASVFAAATHQSLCSSSTSCLASALSNLLATMVHAVVHSASLWPSFSLFSSLFLGH